MLTSPKTGVGCGFEKLILREVNAFDNLQESRVGINKTRNMSPSFQTAYLPAYRNTDTLLCNDDKSVVVMIRHTHISTVESKPF